jgi:hypothetical protein
MRGKKADTVFISEFIQHCVAGLGLQTSDDIVKQAKIIIQEIDEDIRAVEKKKITRSKLLDVIAAFEKPTSNKAEEAKMLSFFKIQYPKTCKEICELLKHKVTFLPTSNWVTTDLDVAEYNFCIKQMIEAKILARAEEKLVRGERFEEYMTFVLGEDQ